LGEDIEDRNALQSIKHYKSHKMIVTIGEAMDETDRKIQETIKSGQLDIMKSEYPSSLSLPNGISIVYLTNLGRENLKKKR
jgi:hypothetical protein